MSEAKGMLTVQTAGAGTDPEWRRLICSQNEARALLRLVIHSNETDRDNGKALMALGDLEVSLWALSRDQS